MEGEGDMNRDTNVTGTTTARSFSSSLLNSYLRREQKFRIEFSDFQTVSKHLTDTAQGEKRETEAAGKAHRWKSFFLPVCLTHGLWSPDEASISVSTDVVRIIGQSGIMFEVLVIILAVDQHSIHHFLFVQGSLEDLHDAQKKRSFVRRNL